MVFVRPQAACSGVECIISRPDHSVNPSTFLVPHFIEDIRCAEFPPRFISPLEILPWEISPKIEKIYTFYLLLFYFILECKETDLTAPQG